MTTFRQKKFIVWWNTNTLNPVVNVNVGNPHWYPQFIDHLNASVETHYRSLKMQSSYRIVHVIDVPRAEDPFIY